MYDKLDTYLTECSSELASDDYWYDLGFEYATEMLENFKEEDWERLENQLDKKTLMWKKRLIYCLGDNETSKELDIIINLTNTEDEELFVMCIDALREVANSGNKEKILFAQIVERAGTLIPKSGIATKKILERFVSQFSV